MIKDLLSLREEEIFKTLKELKDCDFVIIGGYAVNAYALPRFSVDCDVVVRNKKDLERVEGVLLKTGYKKEKLQDELQYSGKFSRYEKNIDENFKVSFDVLVGSVADRMSGVVFAAGW